MSRIDIKIKFAIAIIIILLAANIKFTLSNQNDLKRMETKTERLAQDLDKIRIEVSSLYSGKENLSGSGVVSQRDVSIMINLQNRLVEMKKEIETLKKKNGESSALTEYREREERLWRSNAEKVKEAWTANLSQNLAAAGFSEVEREMVTEDYTIVLDKMRDEQLRWYKEEITSDELNDISKILSREFFDNMSYSIGEQKASIVMGILFS
ncbi:MAG TPA: hypothetical protein ENN58_01805 [bacterium]|nr:hypothetical protein [bacterium]